MEESTAGGKRATGRQRFYVGLAATLHDSALAILGPDGAPLFAEASERYLQCKRAYNCPPDDLVRIPRLIEEHCEPGADVVAAVSWSRSMLERLNAVAADVHEIDGREPENEREPRDSGWPVPDLALLAVGLRNSVSQAGMNLAGSIRIPNRVLPRRFYPHHLTHAALAAFSSPFEECAVAIIDGYGEDRASGFYRYCDGELAPLPDQEPDGPSELRQHVSLGHFYARICGLCGFDPIAGEEWKVMGLAPYGEIDAGLYQVLRSTLRVDGLNLKSGCSDAELSERIGKLQALGRRPDTPVLKAARMARTGQQVFEDVASELLAELARRADSPNLALAGGCALNSSFNGKIVERTAFERLHVPSAPADDGCAIGAALLAFREDNPGGKPAVGLDSPYLGSSLSPETLARMLRSGGLGTLLVEEDDIIDRAAQLLADGKIVGWIQGRAEFGPRALGNRSILADPRDSTMKDRINSHIKFREDFRPFAPSILDEHGADYFERYQTSRYMERTLRFRSEVLERVPAVVHVNGTGRLQSVRREWNPAFYDLIRAFHRLTGVPILLNTSFNVMGKPIVHSVEDAIGAFFTTGLDALVLGDCLIEKGRATKRF